MTGTTQLGGGFGFLIPTAQIMPVADPLWLLAPQAIKEQLWRVAEREVLAAKRSSLLLGDSTEGGKLLPIHQLTRYARRVNIDYTKPPRGRKPYSPQGRANENNPPLVATGHRARAVVLFRTATTPGGIWGYWDRDPHTGKFWGQILYQHRQGFTQTFYGPSRSKVAPFNRHNPGFQPRRKPKGRQALIPQRDVIGLTPQWTARVASRVNTAWLRLRPRVQNELDIRQDPPQRGRPSRTVTTTYYEGGRGGGIRNVIEVARTGFGGIRQGLGEAIGGRVRKLLGGLFGSR